MTFSIYSEIRLTIPNFQKIILWPQLYVPNWSKQMLNGSYYNNIKTGRPWCISPNLKYIINMFLSFFFVKNISFKIEFFVWLLTLFSLKRGWGGKVSIILTIWGYIVIYWKLSIYSESNFTISHNHAFPFSIVI